jgi:chaperonin GroES
MIKPTADYVFLTIEEKKEDKKGIILSDISKEKQPIGLVEAVGPDVKGVKVGDKIIFNQFILKEIKVENKTLYFLQEKQIYGIIK